MKLFKKFLFMLLLIFMNCAFIKFNAWNYISAEDTIDVISFNETEEKVETTDTINFYDYLKGAKQVLNGTLLNIHDNCQDSKFFIITFNPELLFNKSYAEKIVSSLREGYSPFYGITNVPEPYAAIQLPVCYGHTCDFDINHIDSIEHGNTWSIDVRKC